MEKNNKELENLRETIGFFFYLTASTVWNVSGRNPNSMNFIPVSRIVRIRFAGRIRLLGLVEIENWCLSEQNRLPEIVNLCLKFWLSEDSWWSPATVDSSATSSTAEITSLSLEMSFLLSEIDCVRTRICYTQIYKWVGVFVFAIKYVISFVRCNFLRLAD